MAEDASIILACISNDILTVETLLKRGSDANEVDDKGRTGVHLACIRGNLDLIKLLHHYGSDLNAKDHHGNTAMHFCGHLNTVIFLSHHNVSSRTLNNRGLSPLDMAERRGICQDALNLLQQLQQSESQTDLLNGHSLFQLPFLSSTIKKEFKGIWYQFCLDLGAFRLTVLLMILTCLSFFIAFHSMNISTILDSRIPIEEDYIQRTEL